MAMIKVLSAAEAFVLSWAAAAAAIANKSRIVNLRNVEVPLMSPSPVADWFRRTLSEGTQFS
jgi:hypothetical protein